MPPNERASEESLPLPFGRPASESPDVEPVSSAEHSPFQPPAAQPEQESAEAPEPDHASTPEPEPATAESEAPAPKSDARQSMRSMMFGEEIPQAPEAEAEVISADRSSTKRVSEETSWPGERWSRAEEPATVDEGATAPQAEPQPESGEAGDLAQAASESSTSSRYETYDPWKPEVDRDSEPQTTSAAGGEPGEAPAAEVPEVPASENGEKPGAGTIVIIEDDQVAASYYATLFKGNGYHVEVANDGVSGVDLCARMQPQVILLDVMMPRQNGILVLQTLRASDETKNTPVVVMSNFSEPTLIKRALQLGALEYVIKTQVEGPALLNALPRWMNREKAFAAA